MSIRARFFLAILAAAALAAACGDDGVGPPIGPADAGADAPAPDGPVEGRIEVIDIPAHAIRALDLLVVIDNSSSMYDAQETLRRSFPSFIEVLRSLEGGLPDLH